MKRILKRVAGIVLCAMMLLSACVVMETGEMNAYAADTAKVFVVGSDSLPYTEAEIYEQLFDIHNKIELDIDMSDDQLLKLQQDYENYSKKGSKSPIYRKADVSFTIHTANDTYTYVLNEVGVRMKGNTSRTDFYSQSGGMYNFIHLKMDFQETFDDTEYYTDDAHDWTGDAAGRKARKDRTFATLEKMDTKWNRNYDTTYIREYYTYEMFRANGVIAPHTNVASVDYAGHHMGVYTIYEPIDKIFIKKYVKAEDAGGDLYKCGWTGEGGANLTNIKSIGIEDEDACAFFCYDLKTNKKTSTHTNLKNLITKLNDRNVTKSELGSLVDMDRFLKFAAVSYFTGNPDDIRNNYNNYYIYFMKSTGKAVFIPYDMDRCLGVTHDMNPSGNGGTLLNPFSMKPVCSNEQENPLFRYTVCAGGYYVSEYAAALKKVASSPWLTTAKFNSVFNTVKRNYANDVAPDINMQNADESRFKLDNVSGAEFSSSDYNISFEKYITAIKATCNTYVTNVDQYIAKPYYIRGSMNNWSADLKYVMSYDKSKKQYTFLMKAAKDISFKVNNGVDGDAGEWYGYNSMTKAPSVLHATTDADGNINVKKGTYIIHFDAQKKQIWITLQPQTISTSVKKLTKTYGNGSFSPSVLGAKVTKGNGKLTYSTSNRKVIRYDSKSGKFVIAGAGNAYIYIYAGETSAYAKTLVKIPVTVNKKSQKITTSRRSYTKYYGTGTFSLKAKASGGGKLTYRTSNSKVAAVSSKGTVTLKGYGKAIITIKAAKTGNYKAASKTVTVTVKPKKEKITSLKSNSSRSVTVKWKKDSRAKGYQIVYSTSRNFKNAKKVVVSSKNTVSKEITGLKKGKTYYVKVRAYTKIEKKTTHGAYSATKKVVVRK